MASTKTSKIKRSTARRHFDGYSTKIIKAGALLDDTSIGGTSDDALASHANNWRMCEESAAEHGHTVHRDKWRLVSLA